MSPHSRDAEHQLGVLSLLHLHISRGCDDLSFSWSVR